MKVVNTAGQLLVTGGGGGGGSLTAGFSTQGNTLGDTGMVTGQLLLVGGANVTLSGSTNAGSITVTIAGATAAPSPVNVSAGTTSNNLATIVFSNSNGFSFGLNGSTITGAQSVQTQDQLSLGVSTGGNTSGDTGVNTGQRLVFVGSNGITLSQGTGAGSTTITISGVTTAAQTNQSAVKALGVSNTGNTAGNTGVSTGIDWVIAGSNAITASQSTAPGGPNTIWISGATQTIQTQGVTGDQLSIGVSTGGNTAGNTTVNSGQRIVFVGSNGITLSQGTGAGSTTITISGVTTAAQTTQSAIKALGVSNTGNTAGNTGVSTGVDWVIAGSNGITASESTVGGGPNTIWISGTIPAAQTTQSAIKAFGASNTGNTAGNTGVSTGIDWVLAGSNSITISESTVGGGPNTLWIQMTQPAAAAGVGGIGVSNTGTTAGNTGTSSTGTWVFAASGNITASQSTGAGSVNTIWYSVPAQSVQTQGITGDQLSVGVSTGGNTSGNTTVNSGTRIVFVGSNGITLSQGTAAGATTITISGVTTAAQTTQSAIKALGVSNTGNTAGNTGVSTGVDWVIAGSNGITASESTVGGGPNTIWISGTIPAAQTTQSAIKAFGASNTGNTAGNTGVSTGIDWVLAGSNSITISESTVGGGPNTLWIQMTQPAAAAGIGGIGVSNTGTTAGNTGTSSTGTWVFAASGNITASQSTGAGSVNTIWLSVPAQTVQTQGVTGDQLSIGVSTGGNTAGNTTVNSGQRLVFVGSNMISISQATGAGSTTLQFSATQSVQTQGITGDQLSIGVSTGGNTQGNTTVNSGQRFVLVGTNGITLSQATGAGSTTISISGNAAQTTQSAIKALGVSNTGNTAGNTGVSTGIDWVIAGSNGITASESTVGGGPNTIWISGITQTNQSAIRALGVSNTGNTAGNTGVSTGIDWVVAGSNNITISESTVGGGPNTIWVSGANAGAAQYSIGVSTGGNTSGTTGVTGTRIVFAGGNAITLSQSNDATGATITISGGGGGGGIGAGVSTGGNTAGSTGTVTTGNVVFVGSGPISLSQSTGAAGSNATITINGPATSSMVGINGISISTNGSTISIYPNWISSYENMPGMLGTSAVTFGTGTISSCVAFDLGQPGSFSFIRIPVLMSMFSTTIATSAAAASSAQAGMFQTYNAVVYSLGTGASSKSLISVASGSGSFSATNKVSWTQSTQYSISLGFSGQAEGAETNRTTQYSISNTNFSFTTNQFTEFSSNRFLDIPFANSLSPGKYWLIVGQSTSSSFAGATGNISNMTQWGPRYSNHYAYTEGTLLFGVMGSTNLTSGGLLGAGNFATAGGGTTSILPISAISTTASNPRMYFQMLRSA